MMQWNEKFIIINLRYFMSDRRKIILSSALSTALLATLMPFTPASAAPIDASASVEAAQTANLSVAARTMHRNPSRIDVFVNKQYPLQPKNFAPKTKTVSGSSVRMQTEAASAYNKMVKAAARDGVSIKAVSGYRSYARQKELFNYYTQIYGKDYASRISAVPGTSEHQTGLAMDVGNYNGACGLQACFESTPVGRWTAKNAHKYGFILRYPKGQEKVTGYTYEPWHYRYVGTKLAGSYRSSGAKTLEHYYGLVKTKKQYRYAQHTGPVYDRASKSGDRQVGTIRKYTKVLFRSWDSKNRRDQIKLNGRWVWTSATNRKMPKTEYRYARKTDAVYDRASKKGDKQVGTLRRGVKVKYASWDSKNRRDEVWYNGRWVWAGNTGRDKPKTEYRYAQKTGATYNKASKSGDKRVGTIKCGTRVVYSRWDAKNRRDEIWHNGAWVWTNVTNRDKPKC